MTRRLPSSLNSVSRPAVGAVALAATATALSGCMYLSPAQTTKSYEAADGTDQTIGSLQLQNLLIVASAKGAPGALQGLAVNNAQSPIKLTVTTGDTSTSITVPAATAVRLDGKRTAADKATVSPVTVPSVAARPGKAQKVTFTTQKTGSTVVEVPVLLNQGPYGTASPSHDTYTTPASTETKEPEA
ncbi:hypothetical protein [Flexivirga lutea]